MKITCRYTFILLAQVLLITSCSSTNNALTTDIQQQSLPTEWNAPIPHKGSQVSLEQWWGQFNDPVLSQLIDAGQAVSPTIAEAFASIAEARSLHTAGKAKLFPNLELVGSKTKQRSQIDAPIENSSLTGLQTSWEIDLFGRQQSLVRAANSQFKTQNGYWHNARISVAAEIATSYIDLRACEAKVEQSKLDVKSQTEIMELNNLMNKAGFRSNVDTQLSVASLAQGKIRIIEQKAACETLIKQLVALTSIKEKELRDTLREMHATLPQPKEIYVDTLPAQVLSQRPDIYAANHELLTAGANLDSAKALRYPNITFTGFIGESFSKTNNISTNGNIWNIGPVTISLPLFDSGARRAEAKAAHAKYNAAKTIYAARLRSALNEVESSLITLKANAELQDQATIATINYEKTFLAIEDSYHSGAASMLDLESVRRSLISAKIAEIEIQQKSVISWIELYRAIGGGWSIKDSESSPRM